MHLVAAAGGTLASVPLPPMAVWTALAVTIGALVVATLLPAFTPARPEMLNVTDLRQAGGAHRLYFPKSRQFSPAVRRQLTGTLQTLEAPLWKRHLRAPKAGVAVPLAAGLSPDVAAPAVTIVHDEPGEQRRITVRCVSAGYALVLSTDVQPLQVTIDTGNGRPLMHGTQDRVRFVSPPPEGILVTFSLPAGTACRLIASSWYLSDAAPEFPHSTSVLYQKAAAIELAL